MIAGMTDFSHQTLDDVVKELKKNLEWLEIILNIFQTCQKTLIDNGYWNNVNDDFKNLIAYSDKFYDTCAKEITEILFEIRSEIQPHHISRIQRMYVTARELNLEFGRVWHREYNPKDYGNEKFKVVEQIYAKGRDMSVGMLDLSNVAERLKDFVGKKNYALHNSGFEQ